LIMSYHRLTIHHAACSIEPAASFMARFFVIAWIALDRVVLQAG